jgi:dihydroflavonol-4-reductase
LERTFVLLTRIILNSTKRVLVTGGTGFLGAYIIKELIENGYRVRAIRRSDQYPTFLPAEFFEKTEWLQGDVLDVVSLDDAMEGVDAVIHSAGLVSFVGKDRERMYQVNVDGTANVVNIALEKGISRMIHISSVAALGRTDKGGHVNEEKKWEESKVNTHYSKSKFKGEMEVWRGIAEGLDAVILNPSTILGFGDWNQGSCAIFKNIYEEFKWYTPGINGFVDVEDVAKVVVMVLESGISAERFIVNGDTWTFKKLMDTISEGFGKKKATRKSSPFMISIAWRMEKWKSFFTGSRPLLTKESARVALSKTYFANDKLLKAFPGFSFTPLDKTIQNACKKYLGTVNAVQP